MRKQTENKLKKVTVLLLSALLVLSTVPVMAAPNVTSYIETFDQYENEISSTNGYPYKNAGTESTALVEYTGSGNKGTSTVITEGGWNNSPALKLDNSLGQCTLRTATMSAFDAEDECVTYSFDFKITKNPDNISTATSSVADLGLNFEGGHVLANVVYVAEANDGQGAMCFTKGTSNTSGENYCTNPDMTYYAYELGEWFNITKTCSGAWLIATLSKADGTVLWERHIKAGQTWAESFRDKANNARLLNLKGNGGGGQNIEMIVDNCQIHLVEVMGDVPVLLSATTAQGETGVLRNQSVSLIFDRDVSGASIGEPTLTGESGSVSLTVKKGQNRIVVSPAALLEAEALYTLSFSGVGGCTVADISFETEGLRAMGEPVTVQAPTAGTTSDTANITFTLKDMYNYPSFSGYALAAIYQEGKMLGMDVIALTNEPTGTPITKTFSLTLPTGAYEAKIIALNEKDGLVPVSSGMVAVPGVTAP